jgi:hypothetical protein
VDVQQEVEIQRDGVVMLDLNKTGGLSVLQKKILDVVKTRGYTTAFDTVDLTFRMDDTFEKPYRKLMASARASASRALRRLVERGLLVKVRSKYIGYSDIFIHPDFTDEPPVVKRKFAEVEAYKITMDTQRLSSMLTVAKGEA